MNTTSLLDQLLKSGRSLLDSSDGGQTGGFGNAVQGALGGLNSDLGKGALMGGALGLLLGSKRVRKLGGNLLAYGGIAALGAVAYRTYAEWQRNQTGESAAGATPPPVPHAAAVTETSSRGVLKALVAAAKSDGHIDARERGLIETEIARLSDDPELRDWLDQELRRPLDPADVARAATTPELAAEMYLASVLVADVQSPMERMYLDELARHLKLDADLRDQLEASARTHGS
ncbi:MAG: tellurite resistance TerB family protein [Candidatus Promineifilaceae bacterium]